LFESNVSYIAFDAPYELPQITASPTAQGPFLHNEL